MNLLSSRRDMTASGFSFHTSLHDGVCTHRLLLKAYMCAADMRIMYVKDVVKYGIIAQYVLRNTCTLCLLSNKIC